MIKHEYNVIMGSNYYCNEVKRSDTFVRPGFRTPKKKTKKNGKEKEI